MRRHNSRTDPSNIVVLVLNAVFVLGFFLLSVPGILQVVGRWVRYHNLRPSLTDLRLLWILSFVGVTVVSLFSLCRCWCPSRRWSRVALMCLVFLGLHSLLYRNLREVFHSTIQDSLMLIRVLLGFLFVSRFWKLLWMQDPLHGTGGGASPRGGAESNHPVLSTNEAGDYEEMMTRKAARELQMICEVDSGWAAEAVAAAKGELARRSSALPHSSIIVLVSNAVFVLSAFWLSFPDVLRLIESWTSDRRRGLYLADPRLLWVLSCVGLTVASLFSLCRCWRPTAGWTRVTLGCLVFLGIHSLLNKNWPSNPPLSTVEQELLLIRVILGLLFITRFWKFLWIQGPLPD
jgi:hypothetical protein